jgi:hypothetical protein
MTHYNHTYIEGDDVLNSKPKYYKMVAAGMAASGTMHFIHLTEARYVL